jgi:hypothetical protein
MSISYHGVVGFGSGKTTLPSVESWGSNMNLLRDPPKSITTRKIDKVGETSDITQMIDNAGDRICEAIQVYARGVNPMVSVSYDNYGNNGGQKAGNVSSSGMNINGGGAKQAYLPYRIMDGGAFRPPIRDQRDLLPLSRLPRTATSSFTKPGFADFSKKALMPSVENGKEYRTIKKDVIKAEIRPTAVYQIETPIAENYEVKYVIKDPLHVSGFSGIEPTAKFNGEFSLQTKINNNPLHIDKQINKKGNKTERVEFEKFNSEKYIQNTLHTDTTVNKSRNVSALPIDESYYVNTDNYTQQPLHADANVNKNRNITVLTPDEMFNNDTSRKIKNAVVIDYETAHTGYEKYEYIHKDIELERSLPQYNAQTSATYNIHKNLENHKTEREYTPNRPHTTAHTNMGGSIGIDVISSRNYNLRPTISAGGFNPTPSSVPMSYKENSIQELDGEKTKLRRSVYEMQQDRNVTIGNIGYI